MAIVSLGTYLKSFFEERKKSLLANYPGLTLHRLKQELKLHAFLNGIDSDDLFEFPYIPHRRHPLTSFFSLLKEGVPLQYITGYAFFYHSHFKVTPDVLIPRSETEILVEMAINEIQKNYRQQKCRVLDLGTGSGVIALSILMEARGELEVVATDISTQALDVARENYFNLSFAISSQHSLSFIHADRTRGVTGEFDLILSNPPYIKKYADLKGVHPQVAAYEPDLALFLEDSNYSKWFAELFVEVYEMLAGSGVAIIEGHEDHLDELAEIAKKVGFKQIQIIKDYTSRKRFLNLKK